MDEHYSRRLLLVTALVANFAVWVVIILALLGVYQLIEWVAA
ncbi:hypothetical protein PGN77_11360 [Klebsiella aerogenes]